MKQERVYLQ